jgi:hypothetical protein
MEIKDELLDIEGIKRSNKPLLDLFIRRTAVLTQTSEVISDLIIRDQWRNASKVSSPNTNISEIEFPSLGTFYISKRKATKRIKRHEDYIEKLQSLPEQSEKISVEADKNREIINQIKNKIKYEI